MKSIYVIIQAIGVLLLFVFPLGTLVGLILIIWGGIGYRKEGKKAECPECKESIIRGAATCKHCGAKLEWPDEKK